MGRSLAVKGPPIIRFGVVLAVLLIVLSVVLSSCLLVGTRGARDLYVAPGREEAVRRGAWEVGAVRVDKMVGSGSLEEEARSILRLFLARDTGMRPGMEEIDALTLDAIIREREFLRDYRSLHAVSVELWLYERDPAVPVAVALYSENSRDTIESHAYLYRVLRRALRLFR